MSEILSSVDNSSADYSNADYSSTDKRVVLAMSGGVDSCAAAILLSKQGYEVIGISMQVWDYKNNGGNSTRATCCSPSDFDDARKISEVFNFPFYVFDFEESFKKNVIDKFVNTYLSGKTPNPCLDCNRKVKFAELKRRGQGFGASLISTGHYARILKKEDSTYGLYTSKDMNKDQSYFLYALTQHVLSTTLFPVGDMLKPEVREVLKQNGFDIASKAESQDICFVSDSVSKFIERTGGVKTEGSIVNSSGRVVGKHDGVYNYTVGQRKGLGVSGKNPLYVLSLDPVSNSVTIGEKEELEKKFFTVRDITLTSDLKINTSFKAIVKMRYRHEGVECLITPGEAEDTAKVEFLADWSTISPGQAAVFYKETEDTSMFEVLGGGIIE